MCYATETFTIAPKTLTIDTVYSNDKSYDGSDKIGLRSIKLDGTVLKSTTVSYSLRQMVELLNENAADFDRATLQDAAKMIRNYPSMEAWQVKNSCRPAAGVICRQGCCRTQG